MSFDDFIAQIDSVVQEVGGSSILGSLSPPAATPSHPVAASQHPGSGSLPVVLRDSLAEEERAFELEFGCLASSSPVGALLPGEEEFGLDTPPPHPAAPVEEAAGLHAEEEDNFADFASSLPAPAALPVVAVLQAAPQPEEEDEFEAFAAATALPTTAPPLPVEEEGKEEEEEEEVFTNFAPTLPAPVVSEVHGAPQPEEGEAFASFEGAQVPDGAAAAGEEEVALSAATVQGAALSQAAEPDAPPGEDDFAELAAAPVTSTQDSDDFGALASLPTAAGVVSAALLPAAHAAAEADEAFEDFAAPQPEEVDEGEEELFTSFESPFPAPAAVPEVQSAPQPENGVEVSVEEEEEVDAAGEGVNEAAAAREEDAFEDFEAAPAAVAAASENALHEHIVHAEGEEAFGDFSQQPAPTILPAAVEAVPQPDEEVEEEEEDFAELAAAPVASSEDSGDFGALASLPSAATSSTAAVLPAAHAASEAEEAFEAFAAPHSAAAPPPPVAEDEEEEQELPEVQSAPQPEEEGEDEFAELAAAPAASTQDSGDFGALASLPSAAGSGSAAVPPAAHAASEAEAEEPFEAFEAFAAPPLPAPQPLARPAFTLPSPPPSAAPALLALQQALLSPALAAASAAAWNASAPRHAALTPAALLACAASLQAAAGQLGAEGLLEEESTTSPAPFASLEDFAAAVVAKAMAEQQQQQQQQQGAGLAGVPSPPTAACSGRVWARCRGAAFTAAAPGAEGSQLPPSDEPGQRSPWQMVGSEAARRELVMPRPYLSTGAFGRGRREGGAASSRPAPPASAPSELALLREIVESVLVGIPSLPW